MSASLPGVANVHSHAFQRALRGTVQSRDPSRADTFWTWRERMYALSGSLDLQQLETVARQCYAEGLAAGFTAVGEFHYVHHQPDGTPYADPVATSRAMLRAAQQAGVRIALLWTVYHRGGFGNAPLAERQRRFATASLDDVWRALDALAGAVDGVTSRVGLAIHSVRAVPESWLGPLAEGARERQLPIHAHVSEQRVEVETCRATHGLSPVALLEREGVLGPDFTAVHATWLDDADVALLADSGSTVCLCPTTEGDLGDGVPRTADLHAAGVPLCIGSDSHAVIDPFSELRFAEYQARAATERRCVLVEPETGEVAPVLRDIASVNGYRALGLPLGGDVVELDLESPALAGVPDPAAAALLAGHPGLVRSARVVR